MPLVLAGVLDAALVLLFAAVGRHSHAESGAVLGVLTTAWPFLAGAAVGWLVSGVGRWADPRTLRGGIPVWAGAVAVGMLLRVVTGRGTAVSFVIVATVVLGIFLLGWRAVAARLVARRVARG